MGIIRTVIWSVALESRILNRRKQLMAADKFSIENAVFLILVSVVAAVISTVLIPKLGLSKDDQ